MVLPNYCFDDFRRELAPALQPFSIPPDIQPRSPQARCNQTSHLKIRINRRVAKEH